MSFDSSCKANNKNIGVLLAVFVFFVDYLAILGAEEVAFLLRNAIIGDNALNISHLHFWVVFPALFLVIFSLKQLYSKREQFWQMMKSIAHACTYGTIAIIVELYGVQAAATTSRLFVVFLGAFVFVFVVIGRYTFKKFLEKFDILQIPVLIIGAGKTAETFLKGISKDSSAGYKVIGFLEDYPEKSELLKDYTLLGGFKDAERVIKETSVEDVIIAAPGLEEKALNELVYTVQPLVKHLAIIPNLIGVPMAGVQIETMFTEKLVVLHVTNNLLKPINRIMKTIFDYVLTILGVIAISPILALIAIWIYKEDPGSIIFKHMRIGKDGKPFPCYKFRSMCVNSKEMLEELLAKDPVAREEWNKNFKLKNDPRITKIGAVLRRTSLDELPQLFNVLKGEMSLVGPRPVIQKELDDYYGESVKLYASVKPGITGMWQVSGRSDTDYPERIALDAWYVCNWSIWLDIMLLWRTVKVVLAGKGAY